jgi:peroxiredoxin
MGMLVVTLALAYLFAVMTAGKPTIAPPRPPSEMPISTRRPLPAYRLTDSDQRELNVDELRKGRVLIVYLTTDCTPCVKEAEVISRLRRDTPPDFHIYGVALENRARLMEFAEKLNLPFPLLSDAGGQLAASLDTKYFPSEYLVEDGIITKIWYGRTRDENELMTQLNIK